MLIRTQTATRTSNAHNVNFTPVQPSTLVLGKTDVFGDKIMAKHATLLILGLIAALLLLMQPATAQAFDLKDSQGKSQKLSALSGKWVVVNFWATWCAPCIKEIPDIAEFSKAQGEKVRVIGIAVDWDETGKADADAAKLIRTAKKFGHTYPLVLSDVNTEKVFGKIKGMPTTIVYDVTGKKVWEKTGPVTKEMLARVVNGEKP